MSRSRDEVPVGFCPVERAETTSKAARSVARASLKLYEEGLCSSRIAARRFSRATTYLCPVFTWLPVEMVLDVGLLLNGTAAHLNTPPHADTPGASTFRSSRSRAFNPATTTVTASTSTPALVLATQQPIVVEPMEEEAMPILMTSKRPRSPSFDRRDGGLGKAKYRSRGPAQSSPTEEEEDQVVPDSQLNQWTATIWPASQQRIGFSGGALYPLCLCRSEH